MMYIKHAGNSKIISSKALYNISAPVVEILKTITFCSF